VFSLIILFSWTFSFLGMRHLLFLPIPHLLLAILVGVGAFVASLFITSIAVRPLGSFFITHQARCREELIGHSCHVTTGRVDSTFGQAEVHIEGDHLIIQVRTSKFKNLKKHDEALIIDFDINNETYLVEAMGKES